MIDNVYSEAWESDFPTSGEYRIGFSMTLNELKGGSATATVYSNAGGSFASAGAQTSYAGGDGDYWEYYDLYYKLDRGGAAGATAKIKVVFSVTYPDGITEQLESNEMFVYSGTFVTASGTTVSGPSDAPVLTARFNVNTALVNKSDINLDDAYYSLFHVIDDDNSDYISLPTPTITWDGNVVNAVFNLTESLPSGKYQFEFALYYNDWEGFASETFNLG